MKHKKTLVVLLVIAIIWAGYYGYKSYGNHKVAKAISPYLPDAVVKISRTETREIPSSFTDETSQSEIDLLSEKEGSTTVFVNKLNKGDRVKLVYFRFTKPYTYHGIDLAKKDCDGFICYRFYMGYAYVDAKTGDLLRLDVSSISPK